MALRVEIAPQAFDDLDSIAGYMRAQQLGSDDCLKTAKIHLALADLQTGFPAPVAHPMANLA